MHMVLVRQSYARENVGLAIHPNTERFHKTKYIFLKLTWRVIRLSNLASSFVFFVLLVLRVT